MGHKRNSKVYNLIFDETTDYAGLEVQVRTLSMGQLLSVWTAENTKAADSFELFMERLVGWNHEDEQGQPVPITRDAVLAEDDDMVNAVIKKWFAEVMGVSAPLESGSVSGEISPVESLLTEVPSESLAS